MNPLDRLRLDVQRDDPYWPAQLAILTAIGLYLTLPDKLTLGPTWLLPIPEALMLGVLFMGLPGRHRPAMHRRLALALTVVAGLAALVALTLLAHYLVLGGRAGGRTLLRAGVVIWGTIMLLGSVAFWELDRGGPAGRSAGGSRPDFLFAQMTDDAKPLVRPDWRPSFADYLYLSVTNATAFSPTDTLPLTSRAKLVMGLQGIASLATIGLVVARAVNILA